MDTSGVHLWLVIWRAYDLLRQQAEGHIESLGICLSDFAVLELLMTRGPTPINRIGATVRLASGSITTAVDRLERRGLVERRNDPEDRRSRVVHLTDSGRRMIACAFADHEKAMERATAALTPAERGQVVELLNKLGVEVVENTCPKLETTEPRARR
jgi:MarR family transcriptional regulator, 2-MHQ and catechol-resistance regulon repressor